MSGQRNDTASLSGDLSEPGSRESPSQRTMVSLRLTQTGRQLLKQQAEEQGVSQSAVVEQLLRVKWAKQTGGNSDSLTVD